MNWRKKIAELTTSVGDGLEASLIFEREPFLPLARRRDCFLVLTKNRQDVRGSGICGFVRLTDEVTQQCFILLKILFC